MYDISRLRVKAVGLSYVIRPAGQDAVLGTARIACARIQMCCGLLLTEQQHVTFGLTLTFTSADKFVT
jgi:hypothetical protein